VQDVVKLALSSKHQQKGILLISAGAVFRPIGVLMLILAAIASIPSTSKPAVIYLLAGVFAVIGGVFVGVANETRKAGRRYLSPIINSPEEVVSGMPFVLYLRTFGDDFRLASSGGRTHAERPLSGTMRELRDLAPALESWQTEEEQLRAALRPFGPMVAVGIPGEKLPELGAARLYLEQDNWKNSVLEMLEKAARDGLVLMTAGNGASLRWEFEQVVRENSPGRLVLLVPMNAESYNKFLAQAAQIFPKPFPRYPAGKTHHRYHAIIRGAIYFDGDWTPHFIRFDTTRSAGNWQRIIESRFVLGMRPVYDRLGADWPAIRWLGMTRSQALPFAVQMTILLVPFCYLTWFIFTLPS
jgi:hypothetical protein